MSKVSSVDIAITDWIHTGFNPASSSNGVPYVSRELGQVVGSAIKRFFGGMLDGRSDRLLDQLHDVAVWSVIDGEVAGACDAKLDLETLTLAKSIILDISQSPSPRGSAHALCHEVLHLLGTRISLSGTGARPNPNSTFSDEYVSSTIIADISTVGEFGNEEQIEIHKSPQGVLTVTSEITSLPKPELESLWEGITDFYAAQIVRELELPGEETSMRLERKACAVLLSSLDTIFDSSNTVDRAFKHSLLSGSERSVQGLFSRVTTHQLIESFSSYATEYALTNPAFGKCISTTVSKLKESSEVDCYKMAQNFVHALTGELKNLG